MTNLKPLFGLGTATICSLALAQTGLVLPGRQFQVPPSIDGVVDDQEWSGGAFWEGETLDEDQGQPVGIHTAFWIGYDDTAIYFATRVYLPDPEDITEEEFRPNVSLGGNDSVTIAIDPFGTISGFNRFTFNQNGASNLNIEGGRAGKAEWLGQFLSAGRRTDFGWEGEATIPWAIMPLPSSGVRDIRFNVDWYISQIRREVTASFQRNRPELTPKVTSVMIPDPPEPPRLRLLPFTYFGYDDDNDEVISSFGIDLKSFFEQIQVVGTIKPDFRNIEGEVLDLDFSNFERLAGETRPFFEEGSDYRQVGRGQRIFASQRIEAIDAGINLYGNLDERTTFGVLATSDLESENVFVASVQGQPDPQTDWSATFVGYEAEDPNSQGARFGGRKEFGDWNVFSSLLMIDDAEKGQGEAFDLGTSWGDNEWNIFVNYAQTSDDLYARVGFIPERDFKGFSGRIGWEKNYFEGDLQKVEIDFNGTSYDRMNGDFYRDRYSIGGEIGWQNGFEVDFGYRDEQFMEDENTTYSVGASYRPDPYRGWNLEFTQGEIRGFDYENIEARFSIRPIRRLQTSVSLQQVKFDGTREQVVGSFNWIMGRYEAVGGRFVYEDGDLNWFVSYRRSGGLGAEWFLLLGDPNADEFRRTLILKLVWPFSID